MPNSEVNFIYKSMDGLLKHDPLTCYPDAKKYRIFDLADTGSLGGAYQPTLSLIATAIP